MKLRMSSGKKESLNYEIFSCCLPQLQFLGTGNCTSIYNYEFFKIILIFWFLFFCFFKVGKGLKRYLADELWSINRFEGKYFIAVD